MVCPLARKLGEAGWASAWLPWCPGKLDCLQEAITQSQPLHWPWHKALMEMDLATKPLIIHMIDLQGKAGSIMPQPSILLLHLPPQTPLPWTSPRDSTQVIILHRFNLLSQLTRRIHTYFCLRDPWRMQDLALSLTSLCSGFYPSSCLSEKLMSLLPVHVGLKGRGQTGSSQTLSDTMNLDIFLHSRYWS